MSVNVTSLAAFKRFLSMPGATIQMERHDWADAGVGADAPAGGFKPERVRLMYEPRTVAKLQTNAVKFTNGSWLYFDKSGGCLYGKLRFEGDTVTLSLSGDGSFQEIAIYRLSVA